MSSLESHPEEVCASGLQREFRKAKESKRPWVVTEAAGSHCPLAGSRKALKVPLLHTNDLGPLPQDS